MASVLHVQNYFFTQAPSVTPFAGGLILAVILVSSAVTASRSRTHHVIGAVLAIFAIGLGVDWLETHNTTVEAMPAAIFAICFEQVSAWLVKLLLPRNVSTGLPWY